ncbi:hypothetical protein AC579_8261 [Pseudocercospora musae]|uniref:NYN domain-containing protein n=1 Tax=Pseudocercospora musae TaxID=113226 RepID=A0A139IVN0_9PEZI|nr:hypothetical protein AC579_8261 [Pseudocercospora musae]
MSASLAGGLWDFSHILDFHNNSLAASTPATTVEEPSPEPLQPAINTNASAANSASRRAHIATFDQDVIANEGVTLGDFSKVWQFTGTTPPVSQTPQSDNTHITTPSNVKGSLSDDSAYIFSNASLPKRQNSVSETTEGGQSTENAQDKPLTKTQRKKANRKARKEKEKAKIEQAKQEAERTASGDDAHPKVENKPALPRKADTGKAINPIAAWQNATTALPQQYAADVKAANEKRKLGAANPIQPSNHKFKETFKKTAPIQGGLGTSRKYEATEYTTHDASGSHKVALSDVQPPAAPGSKQKAEKKSQITQPSTDDEEITAKAVNAVQQAMASLKRGDTPTPSPNTGLPRTKSAPLTPVKAGKQAPANTQPVQRSKNFTTPKQVKNLNLVPATVGVQPAKAVNTLLPSQPVASLFSQIGALPPTPKLIPGPHIKAPAAIEPLINRSEEDRHLALLMRCMHYFPADRKHLVSPMNMTSHNKDPKGIHIFVDASNIFIGFMDALKQARGIHPLQHMPQANLSFDSLALLMERRRPVAKRVLAGSNPWLPAFDTAKNVGYEMNILDKVHKARELTERQIYFKELDAQRYGKRARAPPVHHALQQHRTSPTARYSVLENIGGSSTETSIPQYAPAKMIEQGVDEILHLKISHSLLDYEEPSTIVLATGDAALAEYSDGFMAMVERALRKGWTVELVSWSKNISKTYLKSDWVNAWDGRFKIIYLDDFAEELLCA